ncbi:family 92 glycoside hydrolase [Cryphonectria parasitica EP155]|uniref:Family 92 glycoside hydrolase n=1 Tax=Cryphonectria parasitica (strain ATCC 38755 / EP155) TaxID=660469 RepID=A0A9P4YEL1_CRYP1|nr:family 92 glycoside hydrolase [Cryphonectria parasitica EP155]KAF3771443.1 family 92 glycoside hydrolase [Cryphonectria parasitica EP155]
MVSHRRRRSTKPLALASSILALSCSHLISAAEAARLSDYVDLLIGTEGPTPGSGIAGGNTFPGAARPWQMAKVGIDTSYMGLGDLAIDCNAGYSPLGNVTGVSMMHVTGTGGNPTYGLISQMPLLGTLSSVNLADNNTYSQNRSLVSETAAVGVFSTTLLDGIKIDVTASNHTGIIRYTFPSSSLSTSNVSTFETMGTTASTTSQMNANDAHIFIDLTHVLPAQNPTTQSYTQQFIRGDLHVRPGSSSNSSTSSSSYYGSVTYAGGWVNAEEAKYFFCANFSVPSGSKLVPTNAYVQPVGFNRVEGAGTLSWPFDLFAPASDRPLVQSSMDIRSGPGNRMGLGALFSWAQTTTEGSALGNATAVLESRVGISHMSVESACGYIEREIPSTTTFEDVVEQVKQDWESNVLSAVEVVDDGSETSQNSTLKKMLYTALYQTALMPTDKTGENPIWTSNESYPYYDDHYTLWDTYRTLLPLYHLLFTNTYSRVVRGLINIFSFEGFLPAGRAANWNGRVQGGTHADLVLGDAFVKSVLSPVAPSSNNNATSTNITTTGLGELGDIDWDEAYRAMVKDAEVLPVRNADSVAFDGATKEGRGALDDYLHLKYITRNHTRSISRGLEYPQDDFALWAVAKGLNRSAEAQARYLDRAGWWENQWNPEGNTSLAVNGSESANTTFTGFAGPRNADGSFNFTNYNPVVCIPSCGWGDDIYEARVWETSFTAAPHDMSRVIHLMGGDEAFVRRLDASFIPGLADAGTGDANNDAGTALFNPGNEPSFPMPFLYNYVPGHHWKTVNQTRAVVDAFYSDARDGYPGNTDAGALPSWLVWNLLGVYPVAGQALYLLGAPRFSSLRVKLFAGTGLERTLVIRADGLAEDRVYPQRVTLDGVALDRAWLSHGELVGAEELVFEMGSEPVAWDVGERPWSLSGWS